MIALVGVVAFPAIADAKPKSPFKNKNKSYSSSRNYNRNYNRQYHSYPRSGFTLSFGTGWAGRGYYYGPPNSGYYYQRPEVRFYRNRYDAPRSYYGSSYGRGNAAVQRELQRRGYYYGPIDGSIGPASRRAIARFEAERGLPVTGTVNRTLLTSLGIW